MDVFLLTKPPLDPRSKLCLKLVARSEDARLYLAGDGVFHALRNVGISSAKKIYACEADVKARGFKPKEGEILLDEFYEKMVELDKEDVKVLEDKKK